LFVRGAIREKPEEKTRRKKAPAPKLMNKGREMNRCREWAKAALFR